MHWFTDPWTTPYMELTFLQSLTAVFEIAIVLAILLGIAYLNEKWRQRGEDK